MKFVVVATRTVVQTTQVLIEAETAAEASSAWFRESRLDERAFGASWRTEGISNADDFPEAIIGRVMVIQ